jgi:hypothetical protein
MKKVLLVLAIFLCATSFAGAAETKKDQQPIQLAPQFQIVPVEYHALNVNGDHIQKAVLKFNSLTGKTWILRDYVINTSEGKTIFHRGWEELESHAETMTPSK